MAASSLGQALPRSAQKPNLLFTVYIDDGFIRYLFQIIEEVSDDVNDPYHYPVIRVLVRFLHPPWLALIDIFFS